MSIPKDLHEGIWGGEAIVEGYKKKKRATNRVPTFWVPNLLKNVLYSEVLDEYFHCTVTQRTMFLIHENYGFDHYILKVLFFFTFLSSLNQYFSNVFFNIITFRLKLVI